MSRRDRLGKGLGALFGEYLGGDPREFSEGEPRSVEISAIVPNPFQPRRAFDEEELSELSASIAENGLLQPLVVRPSREGSGENWELVAGERRWRAVRRRGWKEVPVRVRRLARRALLAVALVGHLP